jgi:hypothetical protein
VGVCSIRSKFEPTGQACAECATAEDCCELPIGMHATVGAESCAELAAQLVGVTCATAIGLNATKCFAQSAYCDCAADTWACEAGSCLYTATCQVGGFAPDGCATLSRSDRPLTATCNTDGACAPEKPTATCANDADCDGEYIADLALTLCGPDECTCYKPSGLCYRACDEVTDCAPGKTCDVDAGVCRSVPVCETNPQCASIYGDPRYVCNAETATCEKTCSTDYDCNGGVLYGIATSICGPNQRCQPIGCSTNNDCDGASVKMFCVEPAPVGPGDLVSSAVTG